MKNFLKVIGLIIITGLFFPLSAFAEGDATKGTTTFKKKCRVCHHVTKGDKAKIGPNLYGIHNRKAGLFEGFNYSKGLIAADLTWDDATLDAYLLKPRDVIKKGKMMFAGVKKEKDRDDVIAYLKTLKE